MAGQGQFFAYMAKVTNQIAGGINGDYRVRGLRNAIPNGRCPWGDGNCAGPGNALVLSEGASLIVFYSNPCIPKAAQIYVSLGPRMFFGPHSVIHATVPAINGNLPNLKHSRIGADGPVGVANCGLRSIPQISDERTRIENPGHGRVDSDQGGLRRPQQRLRLEWLRRGTTEQVVGFTHGRIWERPVPCGRWRTQLSRALSIARRLHSLGSSHSRRAVSTVAGARQEKGTSTHLVPFV